MSFCCTDVVFWPKTGAEAAIENTFEAAGWDELGSFTGDEKFGAAAENKLVGAGATGLGVVPIPEKRDGFAASASGVFD